MLETEDMDDDYFTPASSTSLANIFGKSRREVIAENESLKYTPPKPSKPEEPKTTECVFACALLGYEWSNSAYVSKGKLGFAILKIIKTGFHNIVLYDSNKATLSCATISTMFEVTVKENLYFSYHDNIQKYWSLNATETEIKKIIDLFKKLDVIVKHTSEKDKGPPETDVTDTVNAVDKPVVKEEKESDTDSSINKRTKLSILNRMASMGQSVLPPRTISTEKTSDSSDTNDANHYKTVRHKPVKSSMRRNNSDKNLYDCQSSIEAGRPGSSAIENVSNSTQPLFTYMNGQMVPLTSVTLPSPSNTSGNDMNCFITEQRVSNSEIRININRMTDKADQILGKLLDIEQKDRHNSTSSFNADIIQKLLLEYENKIEMYESIFKAHGLDKQFGPQLIVPPSQGSIAKSNPENADNSDKIQELEKLSEEKDVEIAKLEAKIKTLQANLDKAIYKGKSNKDELHVEIDKLKQVIDIKNMELSTISLKHGEAASLRDDNENIGSKIKNLMNDTFRAISTNFENDKEYSGERVKAVTGAVIKKVTIESLNNL